MKGLIIFCLFLTLVSAVPLKGKPKNYSRKQNRQDAAAPQLVPKVAPIGESRPVPYKQDIVVNAYVSADGQVLVPLDVYQKYFHNSQPLSAGHSRPAPFGIFSRQENEQPSAASSEEEDEADVSSEIQEEKVPVRVSPTSVIYPETVKNETNVSSNVDEEEDDSEKEKPASSNSPEETEDKSNSAESGEEKPLEQETGPVQPVNSFNPPPLAAIPATRPTGEDDEEEAGRYFPYYEDFPENEFLSANNHYYRVDGYDY